MTTMITVTTTRRWPSDRGAATSGKAPTKLATGPKRSAIRKTSLFGPKWYQDHPQAWKYDNNKANVWVTATVPGVYSWLGWGTMPPQYQAYYANAPMFDASPYGEWYPLGVFSLMSNSDDMGTRIVQLAVDRHGHLAGTYFDMITDAEHSIVGEINRQTQRAEWSLRKNRDVTFRAQHLPVIAAVWIHNRAATGRRSALAVCEAGELIGL